MSGKGWRITFVDTMALLFVFLVVLGMRPLERVTPAASWPVAAAHLRPAPAAGAGMLAAMVRSAADQGRLGDAIVRIGDGRVTIERALPLPVDGVALDALVQATASIGGGQRPVAIAVTVEVPTAVVERTLDTLQPLARRWPGRWLVRASLGQIGRLTLALEPMRG